MTLPPFPPVLPLPPTPLPFIGPRISTGPVHPHKNKVHTVMISPMNIFISLFFLVVSKLQVMEEIERILLPQHPEMQVFLFFISLFFFFMLFFTMSQDYGVFSISVFRRCLNFAPFRAVLKT